MKGLDVHSVLRNPLITEKDMKKLEDENTMVFIVHNQATKPQIRRAFEKVHGVKVRSVNVIYAFFTFIDPQHLPRKKEGLH